MPELPEVETIRRQLERKLKGKRIVDVFVDQDRFVFDKDKPSAVKKALTNAKVKAVHRKGKYLWLELDTKPWVVIHFGMSGNTEFLTEGAFKKAWGGEKLWAERKKNPVEGRPPYCRLLIKTKGDQIAVTDPRKFGRIRLANDPLNENPIARLGPDPLEEFPPLKELQKTLSTRRVAIKSLLLDQKVFAGVGNWIADEILFQAGISPHRLAKDLSNSEIKKIRTKTLSIIEHSVKLDADYDRYPKTWLFHDRWGKGTESYTSRGYEIKHDTIGGRTTAWVPALQT